MSARYGTWLICPLTGPTLERMRKQLEAAAEQGADAAECRLDLLERIPSGEEVARLLAAAPIPVIATCRPERQGGSFRGDEACRLALLSAASGAGADCVDCEIDVPEPDRPEGRMILSHHDFCGCPSDLEGITAQLNASQADIVKVAFAVSEPSEALWALDAARAGRKPGVAIAMGEAGVASRLLARKFGLFGTFAALAGGQESAPGQPTIEQFKRIYRWDSVGPDTAVYGVIGHPVGHSMSPAIHNAAFEAAGLDAVYVPLLVPPGRAPFDRLLDGILERPWLDWRGLSVTLPHKENAIRYVGAKSCDELTRRIGAVNTLTVEPDGRVVGANTDYAAAIDALCDAMSIPREGLAGRRVAVLGAGGVSRALVAALAHYGAKVTVCNRTYERALRLAEEFACSALPIADAADGEPEIVINGTSVGMHPNVDATPLPKIPSCTKVVFDTVYNPIETKLLADARSAGRLTVSGLEMFVNQAVAQFETWAGVTAPRQIMRDVVVARLAGTGTGSPGVLPDDSAPGS